MIFRGNPRHYLTEIQNPARVMNTEKRRSSAPSRGKKTWREKLADDKDLRKVFVIGCDRSKRWGEGTCAIPAPREVDALMRRIPRGRLTTINQLREAVARKHGATIGCPITTGIFSWIAAHAAAEAATAGETNITPYWRTLKVKGELNPKVSGRDSGTHSALPTEATVSKSPASPACR